MTFFVTLAADAKSIAARCYFPTPRRARSTFFTLFNAAAEVAADLRGSGREGNPIFYMEMCKWHACLSLVREFLGWRETSADVQKRGRNMFQFSPFHPEM